METRQNTSAACSLRVTDNIMRTAMIAAMIAAVTATVVNVFFIFRSPFLCVKFVCRLL